MRFAAPRSSADLAGDLDRATSAMAAASAEALRVVTAFDERRLWRRDGATSMSSWLAGRYGLAWGTAREWVRVAHALQDLPLITRAYEDGRLSWDQLRPLTRFVTSETEERWAEEGPRRRPAWLWREARRHERVRAREAEETRRRRYLRLDWDRERSVLWLEGMLPAEEGTALQAAIAQRAEEVPRDPDAADAAGARLACPGGLGDGRTRSGHRGGARRRGGPCRAGAGDRALAGRDRDRAPAGLRRGPAPGLRRTDRVGPGVGGTAGRAGSLGASGNGGCTPTTWSTGPTVEAPTWTTWRSCATPTTA